MNTIYFIIGSIFLVGILVYFYSARNKMMRHTDRMENISAVDHKIIRDQINLIDNKILDLEVRMRILEKK